MGGAAPRILSLDAYFMNEVEKLVKDPDTGRRYILCTCSINYNVTMCRIIPKILYPLTANISCVHCTLEVVVF